MTAAPGCTAVRMDKAPESIGGILIPLASRTTRADFVRGEEENIAGFEPNVGTVICADPSTGLQRGDTVLVRDGDGMHLDGLCDGETRLYGVVAGPEPHSVEEMPVEESVVAVFTGTGGTEPDAFTEETFRPTGQNIHILRHEAETVSDGGVILPDGANGGTAKATVLAVGPEAARIYGYAAGQTVLYNPAGELDFYDSARKSERFIRARSVMAVLE